MSCALIGKMIEEHVYNLGSRDALLNSSLLKLVLSLELCVQSLENDIIKDEVITSLFPERVR